MDLGFLVGKCAVDIENLCVLDVFDVGTMRKRRETCVRARRTGVKLCENENWCAVLVACTVICVVVGIDVNSRLRVSWADGVIRRCWWRVHATTDFAAGVVAGVKRECCVVRPGAPQMRTEKCCCPFCDSAFRRPNCG